MLEKRGGTAVPLLNGVTIRLKPNEMEDEDNNEFIRWAHRARHLSSMLVLRDSVSVADVLLEHKIRYEYAKLKAKGNLRSRPVRYAPASQHEGAEATSTVMSSRHDLYVASPR